MKTALVPNEPHKLRPPKQTAMASNKSDRRQPRRDEGAPAEADSVTKLLVIAELFLEPLSFTDMTVLGPAYSHQLRLLIQDEPMP